jgi:exodeoxyribonuclease V beta subunit
VIQPAAELDLAGALPTGRLVVEASAGTGKTYAVAAFVTRLVAEDDIPIRKILVTTFTRVAAQELRDRIRLRLLGALDFLLSGREPQPNDSVEAALSACDATERKLRSGRIGTAVSEFDAATISTIHGFCQRVLRMAGSSAQLAEMGGSGSELVAEVVNDVLVAASMQSTETWDSGRLELIVKAKLGNPTAELWQSDAPEGSAGAALDLVERCVAEVNRRMLTTLSYDALLQAAVRLVANPDAAALRAAVQERFAVAVVDEAQDTDPLQWQLFDALFPAVGRGRLIVVGDPKQSIYAFRGADVNSYLQARASAERKTLSTNFRSDQALLDVLNCLMAAAQFGPQIEYQPVQAEPRHQLKRAGGGAPVADLLVLPADYDNDALYHSVVQKVRAMLATELLRANAVPQVVRPGEIAILVDNRYLGQQLEKALRLAGIPAVSGGTEAVTKSDAATELRSLLRALLRPAAQGPARRVALGWFGNQQLAGLVAQDDAALVEVQESLAGWANVLQQHGVAALGVQLLASEQTLQRMLATGHGERRLTDLAHLLELLHERTHGSGIQPQLALDVLNGLGRLEDTHELISRRVESDADAVQILTVHAAKGLQFPVVLVPIEWKKRAKPRHDRPPIFRAKPDDLQRRIDVSWLQRKAQDESWKRVADESAAEQARLLYVAVTRAQHKLVLWLATDDGAAETALYRCFGIQSVPSAAAQLSAQLAERIRDLGSSLSIVDVEPGARPAIAAVPRAAQSAQPEALRLAAPPPPVVQHFLRWSFSRIVARSAANFDDAPAGMDEFLHPLEQEEIPPVALPAAAVGLLAAQPAGTRFGTLVHAILQRTDASVAALEDEIALHFPPRGVAAQELAQRPALVAGLAAALRTPLGPALNEVRLCDLQPAARLPELWFDLTLAEGSAQLRASDIGRLLADQLPQADVLRPYADRLAAAEFDIGLSGMLTGSIDALLQLPGAAGQLLVVDYKSNRLALPGAKNAGHAYLPQHLCRAMEDNHYVLQALLYLVAAYRFLRWRTARPDPHAQLAGFAYLFVRGMLGPDTPRDAANNPAGVFAWQAPPGLIGSLSRLLAGRLQR